MSRGRKDMDQLLRDVRKAGLEVDTHGTAWKVTNPLTRECVLLARQPTGRGVHNEKAKLRRIGFEPGMPSLRVRIAPPPAGVAEDQPPEREPEPPADTQPAEPQREDPPVPEISDTVRITGKGRNLRDDLPTNCWFLWQAIHEKETLEPHELDAVQGVLWRGSLSAKIDEMWGTLPRGDSETRNVINRYLRATGNMICLKRESRPPLWWLSSEWIEVQPEMPERVPLTRTERRLTRAAAGENRPPAPVTTRNLPAAAPPGKEATGVDALAAIAEVLERVKTAEGRVGTLEQRNLELEHVNEALERTNTELQAKNAELDAQVARVRDAFKALGVSA